jgi:Holliday junction resolvase RusA-like endonuclease
MVADAIAAVRFVVPGEPVPQPRVRRGSYAEGKRGARAKDYKLTISWGYAVACRKRPLAPAGTPVRMVVVLIHTPPKTSKKFDLAPVHTAVEAGLLVPMVLTPDVDNVLKAIADALKGLAWEDDDQLYDVHPIQFWGSKPSTTVELEVFPATVGAL